MVYAMVLKCWPGDQKTESESPMMLFRKRYRFLPSVPVGDSDSEDLGKGSESSYFQ